MASLVDLIPGISEVRMILAGACAAGVLFGVLWVKHEWDKLQTLETNNAVLVQNNKALQENNDVLKGNFTTCSTANSGDAATIASLLKERADAQKAVTTLAAQKQADTAAIGLLGQKLTELEKVAGNDGALAPDLRETIRGILLEDAPPKSSGKSGGSK